MTYDGALTNQQAVRNLRIAETFREGPTDSHGGRVTAIEWCLDQQLQAASHLVPGHVCDHPLCTLENNRLWWNDALAEELEITCEQSSSDRIGNQTLDEGRASELLRAPQAAAFIRA